MSQATRCVTGLVVLLCSVSAVERASACVTNPEPIKLTQADGTEITLRFRGDKFYHWYEDLDGYSAVLKDGQYYFALRGTDGHLSATEHLVGKVDPRRVGLAPKARPSVTARASRRQLVLPDSPAGRGSVASIPPAGTVSNLVVLCKFADHTLGTHTRPEADYDVLFNQIGGDPVLAPTGSVKDCFLENSYGIMTLNSTVTAWVTLPHDEAYYTNGSSGLGGSYPQNPQGMVEDALDQVDSLIDFGNFDADNDGYIDAISIVHSGYGAETGGGGGFWMWSHRWSLWALPGGEWTSGDTNGLGNPVRVYDYHTEPALWGTSGTDIARIGVIVHETGHFFGLPDLYDTNGGGEGIGSYAMMANSWGFDGSQLHPPHFSAFSKIFLGWASSQVVNAPGVYLLDEAEFSPDIIRIDANYPAGEYLLVENRQPVGIETAMPQGGLCVWHVDEAKCCNTDEGYPGQPGWPGNNQHYRIALLQADGDYDLENGNNRGDGGDVFHSGGVDAITPSTVPNTDAYQGGAVFGTNNELTAISAAGSTMSFTYGTFLDCNSNGTPDDQDISGGSSEDCNSSGVPDECELGANDCNGNGIPDDCDISDGLDDCDTNGVPDACETTGAGQILVEDFESGLPGTWSASGIFQVTPDCSVGSCDGGGLWAYAGSTASCTYGDSEFGELLTPPIPLSFGDSRLSFCHRYDTEAGFDYCRILVGGFTVWEASGTSTSWQDVQVDLSPFNGQTIQVSFQLASDAFVSGTLGWQVDNVVVTTGAVDCNQNGIPDSCDIDSGTSMDTNGDGIPDECAGCTENSQCDDGIFCNGEEICDNGVCVAGLPVDCNDGVSCTVDSCDEGSDACVNATDDGACDNGLFCDGTETCEAGVGCVAGTPVNCGDGISCTVDSCDEGNDACVNAPDDGACDNGLFCDGAETCEAGVGCVAGTPVNCGDGVSCTVDTCDESADACVNTPDNGACDNGLFCDGAETCAAGVGCVSGTPVNCDDGIDCTVDSCDEDADACVNAPDNGVCDNGLFCDGAESCVTGVGCVAGTPVSCDDGIACTVDACDEGNDACVNTPDNGTCDNGLFCDGTETCDAGAGCVSGTPVDCNDGIACTIDSCDENADACANAPDNGACDNGVFCDGAESCQSGVGCISGTPVDCGDGIACTADSCDENADACVNAPNNGLCDTGLFCDGVEICEVGVGCVSGPPVDCNDNVACTVDSCDEDANECVNMPDDVSCNNGLFCDGIEACDAEIGCVAGPPVNCSDGVDCTVDSCDEVDNRCNNLPDDSACDNGLYCDGSEICNPKLGCEDSFDPCLPPLTCDEDFDQCVGCVDGLECDDGNACTDDICSNGQCSNLFNYDVEIFCCNPNSGGLINVDDGDPCTQDVCNESTGEVTHTIPNPDLCAYGIGSRYVSIVPTTPPGEPVALLIRPAATTAAVCFELYVQPGGSLDPVPAFQTPEEWGIIDAYGEEIIPDTTYDVFTDDGEGLSLAVQATTSLFGDVDRNGVINLADVQLAVLIFQNLMPYEPAADLKPCDPNQIINFEDIFAAVQGFQGFFYEDTTCDGPC